MSKLKQLSGFILAILIILLMISIGKNYVKLQKAGAIINEARNEVHKEEEEQTSLEMQLKEAESQEFIEKQLRDKLGMAKEGEIVIVLPEADSIKSLAPKRNFEEELPREANWKKWQKLFF
jgi:cell division protein FtsB